MFRNLPESGHKSKRRAGVMAVSFTLHYGLLLGAIVVSAKPAIQAASGPRVVKINLIEPKPEPAPEPKPVDRVAPPPPKTTIDVVAPVTIPSVLPEINLGNRVTPSDWQPRPIAPPPGTLGGKGSGIDNPEEPLGGIWKERDVEIAATFLPNSPSPEYPDILRRAGVEGEALVQFVVDSTGKADMTTFRVLHATHSLFADAVRNVLPRVRFSPAQVGNRRVRQLAEQVFGFSIRR